MEEGTGEERWEEVVESEDGEGVGWIEGGGGGKKVRGYGVRGGGAWGSEGEERVEEGVAIHDPVNLSDISTVYICFVLHLFEYVENYINL